MSRLSDLTGKNNNNDKVWFQAADYLWDLFTEYKRLENSISFVCKKTETVYPGVLSETQKSEIIRMARADRFMQSRKDFNASNHIWGG